MEKIPVESETVLTPEEEHAMARTKELYSRAIREQGDSWGRIITFARGLQAKYPKTVYGCRLYHQLIGSTPGEIETFDIPGEDSVARFVEEELARS